MGHSGVMVRRTRKTQRSERFQMSAHFAAMARMSQVRLQTSEFSWDNPRGNPCDAGIFLLCVALFLGRAFYLSPWLQPGAYARSLLRQDENMCIRTLLWSDGLRLVEQPVVVC